MLADKDGKTAPHRAPPTLGHHRRSDLRSRPEPSRGLGYLKKVFRTLREIGFGYFKIDFLSAGLRDGQRHDPSQSPVEAFRRALAVIRDAIGDDFCSAVVRRSCLRWGSATELRVSSDVKSSGGMARSASFAADGGHPAAELAIWNDMTQRTCTGAGSSTIPTVCWSASATAA